MVHGSMIVFIFFCGLLFSGIFESIELLSFIIFDVVFRSYGFIVIYSLGKKFENEESEVNLLHANANSSFCDNENENGLTFKRDSFNGPFMNGYE